MAKLPGVFSLVEELLYPQPSGGSKKKLSPGDRSRRR